MLVNGGLKAQNSLNGLPFIKNYSPQQYKAGIQNWDIAQDMRGVIYLANNYGLLEYDGHEWETYRTRNGAKMRSVALANDGKIYVGSQGDFGFFFPDNQGRLTYTSLADSLPSDVRNFDEAWSVFIDQDNIYFCTFGRIYIYTPTGFTLVESSYPLELSFHINREVFVLEKNHGLARLKGRQLQLVPQGDFFAKRSISSMQALSKEKILISTFQDGVFLWENNQIKPWTTALQQRFKESIVNCMLLLRNGNVAIGTQNNGLLLVGANGELLMELSNGKGLQNRTILSLYEDDLGNLWIGQNNGISYVELGSPFSHVNEQSDLPGTGYAALLEGNKLYLGTNNGLYVKNINKPLLAPELVEGTRGQVYHIGKYDNDLLVGHHTGAYRIEGLKSKRISDEPGAWIFATIPTEQNLMVGGLYNGLQLFRKEGLHWKFAKKLSGFSESSRVMEFDKSGDLWITHGYKGAFKAEMDKDSLLKVDFYANKKGFPSNNLINVFSIRNELTFTSEYGLYIYEPLADTFVNDGFYSKLLGPNAQIWMMREDSFGNIYFIGSDKVGVLKRNSVGEYTLESNSFNRIRSFLNDDLENLHVLSNNEVLFGSKEGFIHYDPKKEPAKDNRFQTLIRRVTIVNSGQDSVLYYGNELKPVETAEKPLVKLSFAQNSIHFRYAATTYEGGEIQFQHYLENFEKDWSDWNGTSQKEYTNLREGRYVFHVRAQNINGQISSESTYTFYIQPPWYRSLMAIATYITATVALLIAAFLTIDRKYKRAQQMMRLKQKKELIKKENEIEKISQQSLEEINRLQNEKLESELMHINKELGTSTFHLLNKNEFISGIKTNLSAIIKREKNAEVQKELNKIVKEIEENISTDSDWEHFQIHFDRVHGDFSKRFKGTHTNLSPQEIKLSAYLRMNLSTKEIAQLLHISVRGVEISRYRLRKKLNLERSINLQEYILGF
jgi:ligand-binding sensor domain-containing protein/DNA-binding CsgD family transcriptional regulator